MIESEFMDPTEDPEDMASADMATEDLVPEDQDEDVEVEASTEEPVGSWYVVHSYSGYENKVKQNLEQRIETMDMQGSIFEVVVPTEEEVEIREGKAHHAQARVPGIYPGSHGPGRRVVVRCAKYARRHWLCGIWHPTDSADRVRGEQDSRAHGSRAAADQSQLPAG